MKEPDHVGEAHAVSGSEADDALRRFNEAEAEIVQRFTAHKVDEMQGARIRYVREEFKDFAIISSFLATAAIARGGSAVDTGVCPIPPRPATE